MNLLLAKINFNLGRTGVYHNHLQEINPWHLSDARGEPQKTVREQAVY